MSRSFVVRGTPPAFLGVVLLSLTPVGPVFGHGTAAQAPSGPVFRHAALEYMSSRQFPRLELEVGGSLAVQSVRLCFRAQRHRDFYFVEMTRQRTRDNRDRFVALLPMPLIETAAVIYYFEVIDTGGRRFISSQFQAKVTATLAGPSSPAQAKPTLDVRPLNPGAPAQPPGFRPDGMVRVLADGAQAGASPGGAGQAPVPPTPPQATPPPPTPPSPPRGGGGGAVLGVVLGAGAVGGVAYYLTRDKEEPKPQADLAVALSTTLKGSATVNVPFSFLIEVSNLGPDAATDVTLTDTVPSSLVIQNVTASGAACTTSGSTVRCTVSSLPAGRSFSIDVNVRPTTAQSSLVNTCSATAAESDPSPGNNSASATVTVQPAPGVADIGVTQSQQIVGQMSIPPYYHIVYRFTVAVQNKGPSGSVPDIDLDVAIQNVTVPLWSLVGGSIQPSPPMSDCSPARAQPGSLFGCGTALAPGQEARVTFDVDAACCGNITSTARTLACEAIDPNCSNNTSSLSVNVITFREAGRAPQPGLPTGARTSTLTSVLLSASAEATQGTIAMNGLHLGAVDTSGPRTFPFSGRPGQNRVEARLVSSPAQTLVWQFSFEEASGFLPGSLVVESGAPTALGDKFVAFRLGRGSDGMARFRFSLAE